MGKSRSSDFATTSALPETPNGTLAIVMARRGRRREFDGADCDLGRPLAQQFRSSLRTSGVWLWRKVHPQSWRFRCRSKLATAEQTSWSATARFQIRGRCRTSAACPGAPITRTHLEVGPEAGLGETGSRTPKSRPPRRGVEQARAGNRALPRFTAQKAHEYMTFRSMSARASLDWVVARRSALE